MIHLEHKRKTSAEGPKWAGRLISYFSRDSKRAAMEVEEYELKQSALQLAGIDISKERQIEAWQRVADRIERQRSRSRNGT